MTKLDAHEQELLATYEAGGFLSVPNVTELQRLQAAAREHRARQKEADVLCAEWNAVLDASGDSIADEFSPL